MGKLKFKNDDGEIVEFEIKPNRRIEITDNDGNKYEIKPYKFGGIEVLASDGSLSIKPSVSNMIVLETNT